MIREDASFFDRKTAATFDFLAGGGEMGERIRTKDWSKTSLGPVEQWPQSLKIIVRIMLTSRQPIWIGWGPELIKLYNDPYKAIVGGKHPEALGQPVSIVWREIWGDVEPRLQAVFHNEGTYDEALFLMMERYGYLEETYYTFSYSPVPGDDGNVGGVICFNTDDTQRIIGERQVKLLRNLASEAADARTVEDACMLSANSLEYNAYDIPFAMIYLLNQEKQTLTLAGTTGIHKGHPAVIENSALDAVAPWPFAEALQHQKIYLLSDLDQRLTNLPTGAWQQPPRQAVMIPLAPASQTGKAGLLIAGLNPFRLFDEKYQEFFNLVASQIAANIANAHAYEEERKRAEALAELDRAKTLFFSNISHEFRTPLTLMLGPIEEILADNEILSSSHHDQIEILHRNSLRLLKLVNALLDFSRIEAGRVQASYELTDLATLTMDITSTFRSAIEKAGMQLEVICPPLTSPVYVDREMWEKIVLNLLSNAYKYTLQGSIKVSLEQKEDRVELSVQDTGVGIPEEEIPHMFERFHRVKGTEGRTHEGTGIGLSLVYELVKLHGGTITVTSKLGHGSTFTISLPVGTAHLPPHRIVEASTSASTTPYHTALVESNLKLLPDQNELSKIIPFTAHDFPLSEEQEQVIIDEHSSHAHILFADDNPDMRAYVGRLLHDHYHVHVVSDGKAALDAVKRYRPDLVLTDVMMPQMNGVELLQALRADPETRSIPVILLSARVGEEPQVEGMEAGADDYLIKPFSARELLARIGAHLKMIQIRTEAENAVRVEREQLYSLFWQAPAAIAVIEEPDRVYTLANPLYQKVSSRTEEQLIGKTIREAFPELAGQGIFEIFDRVFATGEPYIAHEFPLTFDRSGTGVFEDGYFNFIAQPIFDKQHHVERILIYAVDVTELIRARQHLKESEERFRTLAENIPNLAWMARSDGEVYWYNAR